MINWEELKHIHVIRKLEGILAQWFNTDIFFVDERGNVQNTDIADHKDKHKEFINPLSLAFLGRDKSRGLLFKAMAEANERVFQGDKPQLVMNGPLGIESLLVSRIVLDGEHLGSVIAYSFVEKNITDAMKAQTN